jgi:hypothetical protein
VQLQAEVTNPSRDLTAESTEVTLAVPDGVEPVAGDATQELGTLQPLGTHGDRATATWTVRGTTDGVNQLVASSTAHRYGSTFRSSANVPFAVEQAPPITTTVEAATPPPHEPPGSTRTPPGAGPPTLIGPASPDLNVTSVRLAKSKSRLIIRGTVAAGVKGRITARWTARIRGRRRTATASVYPRSQAFKIALKLPRRVATSASTRARLKLSYKGDQDFIAQARHLTVRTR